MALTATQKAQIRLYLGFPDGFRYRNTRLESVMDNLSPEAELQITALLTSLATVDTQILTGTTTAITASVVKRVDEITFHDPIIGTNLAFKNGKDAGRYLAGRISIILGVPFNTNAFGTSGYPGDDFFPGFGSKSGPINLG